MASSLGYVLMNWTSEFSKHSKTKKNKKKQKSTTKNEGKSITSNKAKGNDKHRVNGLESATMGISLTDQGKNEMEVQTDDVPCLQCEGYAENMMHLESQLSDANIIQENLRQKLLKTKATLSATIERESKLRNAQESLELEEAQVRYELEEVKANLLKQLEERDQAHSERVRLMEQVMNAKDCEWAKKNELLQKELRSTLRSVLQDTEREEHSLTSLEQEIESLRSVIDMRSSENKHLQTTNAELTLKVEHQAWLETELEKAKHRLEELAVIVQNKMVSERELLELSEALQRDLVQSRAESLHYKQQIENRQYLLDQNEKNLQIFHKVKHSQSDLFPQQNNQLLLVQQQPTTNNQSQQQQLMMLMSANNQTPTGALNQHIINNDISKQSTFLHEKPSNLQQLKNWVNDDSSSEEKENNEKTLANDDDDDQLNNTKSDRNQHQKASSGNINNSSLSSCEGSAEENDPSLVLNVREKTESVAWVIQIPPSPNAMHNERRRKRN